ncbi:MAG TPA: hypothetical protein VFS21_04145 [Roseiflexaceae bacterium]|nr:hypothetical protein [Roseiflexaceae bacterium]
MHPLLNNLRSLGLTLGVAAFLAVGAGHSSSDLPRLQPTSGRVSPASISVFADDNGNAPLKSPISTGSNGASTNNADDNGNKTPTPPPSTGNGGPAIAEADDNGNKTPTPPPSTGNGRPAIAEADDNGNSTPKPPSTGSNGAAIADADDNGNARYMPAIAHHGTSTFGSIVG